MDFADKLKIVTRERLNLCVGLDPVVEKMPPTMRNEAEPLLKFCSEIVAATADYAAAFKPNIAFFEAYGSSGWRQLERLMVQIPAEKLVIIDCKRSDIGSTAQAYAQALFRHLRADAATINPYLGPDAIEPFIADPHHGVFILAVTSNPSGGAIQDLTVNGTTVSGKVIQMARRLNKRNNVGLVLGATRSDAWSRLVAEAVDLPLLIPGIGAQGGDLTALKMALKDYSAPALVNVSRGIIYASGGADFADAARKSAERYSVELKDYE